MSSIRKIFFSLLCLSCGQHALAQGTISIAKKRPLLVTGTIGASANYYTSNETIATRPSFSWNVYGNITARTGKWTLPASFVVNQFSNSNSSPYVQVGISPTYKWARFHVGFRNIPFSPLTFEGQSFRGVGVELYPKNFRFAAFYGRLNKAVSEDTAGGRFRVPQYSRTGYGFKVGVGNATRFVDLIYFHAKDDSTSAAISRGSTRRFLRPQENAVVGLSFKLTFAKRWIWTGNTAVSGLVLDLSGKSGVDTTNRSLRNFIGRFLPNAANVSANYAAQSSLSYFNKGYSGNLGYQRVQPGFKSLGTPYMFDDIELVSFINNVSLVKGKVNVGTNFTQQHNNLSRSLLAELRTQVANLYINTILGQRFSLNLNFSGYNLRQRNDRNNLPDSLRLNDTLLLRQQISQISFMPSYNLTKGNNIHYISGNLTVQSLKDGNEKTASQTNSENFSGSLTYTLAFINKPYSFSLNYLRSQYKQRLNSYTSNGATVGASAQLLKNRRWNIQGNFGFFSNRFNATNTTQKNLTYSLNTGYRGRHNALNLFVNYIYTPPNNAINEAISRAIPYAIASRYLYGGVQYSYSF